MRAVIYARYSSNNQSEASIEDQVEVCRRYVKNQRWKVVNIYHDRALSGGSAFRPAYQQLLADADNGSFDVVVCEALDRLGRKLSDMAALHDRLEFSGIEMHAVNLGRLTTMHIGLMGTMAQLYLSDLKEKTKRGQLGRALAGKIPGGKAYAYDLVDGKNGERKINQTEARIVRRIFAEFAKGKSPRAIAKTLNDEGVVGPRGQPWLDTTIRGQLDRGTGILNNALYAGRIEWNRCSYVKNPKTGKRIARPNSPEDWEVVPAPDLRVVDNELWERVKDRQRVVRKEMTHATGQPLNSAHRRHFLLSGLLECGHCGGGYTIMGRDRYGCATRRSKGTCENSRTVTRQDVEARVLEGLKHRLMAPELLKAFVDEYRKEMNRLASENAASRADLKNQLARTERRMAGSSKRSKTASTT